MKEPVPSWQRRQADRSRGSRIGNEGTDTANPGHRVQHKQCLWHGLVQTVNGVQHAQGEIDDFVRIQTIAQVEQGERHHRVGDQSKATPDTGADRCYVVGRVIVLLSWIHYAKCSEHWVFPDSLSLNIQIIIKAKSRCFNQFSEIIRKITTLNLRKHEFFMVDDIVICW